jgi:chromate reductase, NAD(P)H dehydrogenase (quinone)
VLDGRLIDEAALSFALAGVDDLIEEIRAARFRSSGGLNVTAA